MSRRVAPGGGVSGVVRVVGVAWGVHGQFDATLSKNAKKTEKQKKQKKWQIALFTAFCLLCLLFVSHTVFYCTSLHTALTVTSTDYVYLCSVLYVYITQVYITGVISLCCGLLPVLLVRGCDQHI